MSHTGEDGMHMTSPEGAKANSCTHRREAQSSQRITRSCLEKQSLGIDRAGERSRQKEFCQIFTPEATARFMTGLLHVTGQSCRVLDAGAGLGALSEAFLEHCKGKSRFDEIKLTAVERDITLHAPLDRLLTSYSIDLPFCHEIISRDFIDWAVSKIYAGDGRFTHAVLNPPYSKINSQSSVHQRLSEVGIKTGNLYSAFVALTLLLMEERGQIVAILPRSFCNGAYFRPFRKFVLEHAAIRHLHLFNSRDRVFISNKVLQETIIVVLEKGGVQRDVTVSLSSDGELNDFETYQVPFSRIVEAKDIQKFIRVPKATEPQLCQHWQNTDNLISDIGLSISTGPILEFRLRDHICSIEDSAAVPLLCPCHCQNGEIVWPNFGRQKPNAIQKNEKTERYLFPKGWYCVVQRISSKEQKRRIIASVVGPDTCTHRALIGFENHLNVFHQDKTGMPKALAYGLADYLNSSQIDDDFRQFSGSTQVNVTDLRQLRYPSRSTLIKRGRSFIGCTE